MPVAIMKGSDLHKTYSHFRAQNRTAISVAEVVKDFSISEIAAKQRISRLASARFVEKLPGGYFKCLPASNGRMRDWDTVKRGRVAAKPAIVSLPAAPPSWLNHTLRDTLKKREEFLVRESEDLNNKIFAIRAVLGE